MSELVIRKAEEGDIGEIAELEKICFPHDPWSEESIRQEITENPAAFYIVAEEEKEGMKTIAGYMGVWEVIDEGHIMNVAVNPDFRRRHIGEAILLCMLDVTAKAGITAWTLEVRVDNEPAINLYEKLGFKPAGIRKGYYEYDHTDALIMWKTDAGDAEN